MRPGADPSLVLGCWQMPPSVVSVTQDWFAGRITEFRRSGDRSVYIPFSEGAYTHIKIKGAGMRGGAIDFGRHLQAGPVAPLFDYDGRRMVDIALGHDGAFVGGASMQQAVTEWRMTRHLADLGYDVVPCAGYGAVSNGTHKSWFSVYQWHEDWIDTPAPPDGTAAIFEDLTRKISVLALELAVEHDLAGYFWCVRTADGRVMLKDLHPFRRLDPMNQSQISWVMQVCYGLHITAINNRQLASNWFGEDVGKTAGLWMMEPVVPGVTLDDWDHMRFKIVLNYMLRDHADFQTGALLDLLEENPITARLLELCPEKYARVV